MEHFQSINDLQCCIQLKQNESKSLFGGLQLWKRSSKAAAPP